MVINCFTKSAFKNYYNSYVGNNVSKCSFIHTGKSWKWVVIHVFTHNLYHYKKYWTYDDI